MVLFVIIGLASIISLFTYLQWRKKVIRTTDSNVFWWKVSLTFAYFALFGAFVGVLIY